MDVDAHPVLESGVLYVSSYDGSLYALKRSGGEVIWRFDSGGSKQVVIEKDRLYLPSTDGVIYALNKSNAKVLWKFEMDRGTPTQLVVTDRHVFVGSSFQYLYGLDKKEGKGLYRFNVGHRSGFSGRPAYDETSQSLYLLSSAGNLYSFSIRQNPRKVRPLGSTDPYAFYHP
jgi:outer membrane protein assembly factor BamB